VAHAYNPSASAIFNTGVQGHLVLVGRESSQKGNEHGGRGGFTGPGQGWSVSDCSQCWSHGHTELEQRLENAT
jgi:hypothetical protein